MDIDKLKSLGVALRNNNCGYFNQFLDDNSELFENSFECPKGVINMLEVALQAAVKHRNVSYLSRFKDTSFNNEFIRTDTARSGFYELIRDCPECLPDLLSIGFSLVPPEGDVFEKEVYAYIFRDRSRLIEAHKQGFKFPVNGVCQNKFKELFKQVEGKQWLDCFEIIARAQPEEIRCFDSYNLVVTSMDTTLDVWKPCGQYLLEHRHELLPPLSDRDYWGRALEVAVKDYSPLVNDLINMGVDYSFVSVENLFSNEAHPEYRNPEILEEMRSQRSLLVVPSVYKRHGDKEPLYYRDFEKYLSDHGVYLEDRKASVGLSIRQLYHENYLEDQLYGSICEPLSQLLKPLGARVLKSNLTKCLGVFNCLEVELKKGGLQFIIRVDFNNDFEITLSRIAFALTDFLSVELSDKKLIATKALVYCLEVIPGILFWTLEDPKEFEHYSSVMYGECEYEVISVDTVSNELIGDPMAADLLVEDILPEAQYKTEGLETGFCTTESFYRGRLLDDWFYLAGGALQDADVQGEVIDEHRYFLSCTLNDYFCRVELNTDTDYLNLVVLELLNDVLKNGAGSDLQFLAYNTPQHGTDFILCCGDRRQLAQVCAMKNVQIISKYS